MLEKAIENLLPGAILVYSVCSLQPEEGPDVVEAIMAKHGDIKRLSIDPTIFGLPKAAVTDKGDIRTLPLPFCRPWRDGRVFYRAITASPVRSIRNNIAAANSLK